MIAMWKTRLGTAGAVLAGGLVALGDADVLIRFGLPAALLGGALGTWCGAMIDAGRIFWKVVGGVVGLSGGTLAVGAAVYLFDVLTDSVTEFTALGALLWAPLGAAVGLAAGLGTGTRIDRRREEGRLRG